MPDRRERNCLVVPFGGWVALNTEGMVWPRKVRKSSRRGVSIIPNIKIVEKVKADGRSCEDQTFSPEKESVNVAVEKKDGNKEE